MSMLLLLSLIGAGAFAGALGAGGGSGQDDTNPDDTTPDDNSSKDTTADATARAGGDLIRGTTRADTLTGDDTDIIRARAGADTITLTDSATGYGETGRDRITLSDTATAYGGYGNDRLTAIGTSSGPGGTAYGGAGNDEISVIDSATASGDAGNDFITWYATAAAPTGHDIQLSGGEGNDTLSAWSQTDGQVTLAGGTGRDLLLAGDGVLARGSFGADTLVGGNGAVLIGGQGADRFIASPYQGFSRDSDDPITINDFAKGRDSIGVHLMDAPSNIALNESDGDTRLTLDWQVSDTETDSMTVLVKGVTGLTLDDFDFVTEAGITPTPGIGFDFQTSDPLDSVALGTPGADRLTAASGDIILATGTGADTVTAGAGTTGGVINLGEGNDTYTATGSRADLVTGAGDDTVDYTTGPDPAGTTSNFFRFDTGAGNDTVTIDAPAVPPSTTGVQLQVDLGSGNDSLIIDKDVTNPIFAFDDTGEDSLSMWMGHSVNMAGAGNDILTIGIDGDHIDTRSATEVFELTPSDRVIIEVEAGITGAIQFVQFPGTGEGDPVTAVQIGGRTVVTFNDLLAANDPRITITRDAVFA